MDVLRSKSGLKGHQIKFDTFQTKCRYYFVHENKLSASVCRMPRNYNRGLNIFIDGGVFYLPVRIMRCILLVYHLSNRFILISDINDCFYLGKL